MITKELISTEISNVVTTQVTNFVDIFKDKEYRSLKTVSKLYGDVHTKQAMIAVIGNVFGVSFDTGTVASIDVEPKNVSLLSDYILETYPDISLKDIQFFAKKLLRGEFIGKKIGDVVIKPFKYDVPTLCLIFQKFYAERTEEFERMKQDESNEMKLVFKEIHPDITKMFEDQEKLAGYNGIYKSLKHYCEINELQESLFIDSYTKLYDKYIDENNEDVMELIDFIRVKSAQFLVFQNSLQATPNINKTKSFNEMLEYCANYDIPKLVEMVNNFGLWMIPTKFYFAAKKILFEGGVLKYRYDISEQSVIAINEFVKKAIEDRTVSATQILFVLSMIFNCSLHIGRFNKYNGLEAEQKTDAE